MHDLGFSPGIAPDVCNLPFRPYDRQSAVYPLPWLRERKFWPSVSRIDDGQCGSPTLRFTMPTLTNLIILQLSATST